MKKRVASLFIFILLGVVLGTTYQYDTYSGEIGMFVNVNNENNFRVKRLTVGLDIPELGIYHRSYPFTLYKKEKDFVHINVDLPYYVEPGSYFARIYVSRQGHGRQDSDYRYVYVH